MSEKKDKLLELIKEARDKQGNTLLSVANSLNEVANERESTALKTYDFFCKKSADDHSEATKNFYRENLGEQQLASSILRAISVEIMLVQKEQWRPINELIYELYKTREHSDG